MSSPNISTAVHVPSKVPPVELGHFHHWHGFPSTLIQFFLFKKTSLKSLSNTFTSCVSGTAVWFCCVTRFAEGTLCWFRRVCGTGVAGAETVLDETTCAEGWKTQIGLLTADSLRDIGWTALPTPHAVIWQVNYQVFIGRKCTTSQQWFAPHTGDDRGSGAHTGDRDNKQLCGSSHLLYCQLTVASSNNLSRDRGLSLWNTPITYSLGVSRF